MARSLSQPVGRRPSRSPRQEVFRRVSRLSAPGEAPGLPLCREHLPRVHRGFTRSRSLQPTGHLPTPRRLSSLTYGPQLSPAGHGTRSSHLLALRLRPSLFMAEVGEEVALAAPGLQAREQMVRRSTQVTASRAVRRFGLISGVVVEEARLPRTRQVMGGRAEQVRFQGGLEARPTPQARPTTPGQVAVVVGQPRFVSVRLPTAAAVTPLFRSLAVAAVVAARHAATTPEAVEPRVPQERSHPLTLTVSQERTVGTSKAGVMEPPAGAGAPQVWAVREVLARTTPPLETAQQVVARHLEPVVLVESKPSVARLTTAAAVAAAVDGPAAAVVVQIAVVGRTVAQAEVERLHRGRPRPTAAPASRSPIKAPPRARRAGNRLRSARPLTVEQVVRRVALGATRTPGARETSP